jgi:hypothetical protein
MQGITPLMVSLKLFLILLIFSLLLCKMNLQQSDNKQSTTLSGSFLNPIKQRNHYGICARHNIK